MFILQTPIRMYRHPEDTGPAAHAGVRLSRGGF